MVLPDSMPDVGPVDSLVAGSRSIYILNCPTSDVHGGHKRWERPRAHPLLF